MICEQSTGSTVHARRERVYTDTGNWGISSEIGCRTEGAWMHASEGGAVKGVRVKNVTVKVGARDEGKERVL